MRKRKDRPKRLNPIGEQAFIQDFTAGGVGQGERHVSLEMFWKYLLMVKDLDY